MQMQMKMNAYIICGGMCLSFEGARARAPRSTGAALSAKSVGVYFFLTGLGLLHLLGGAALRQQRGDATAASEEAHRQEIEIELQFCESFV